MSDWPEYFTTVGVLFFFYICIRWSYLSAIKLPPPPKNPPDFDGKAIEITAISNRIHDVRERFAEAKVPANAMKFKQVLRVENKRAEIARLAFFQDSPFPQSEPHDTERGLHLLMI